MDSNSIKDTVGGMFPLYVKDLEFLTNIDSVTGNIENSRKIEKWLHSKIMSLGGIAEVRDNGRGAHVIARFKGDGKKRVLLVVHTDTVMGTEGGKRLFRMDENNIAYGAGVGDCKASAVQMLYLMKAVKQLNMAPYAELVIYFDAEEESSSPDEYAIAEELARQSDYAIICDTGRPGWGICTRRKGIARYTVDVKGTSGHAGNAPHSRANAVAEAAYIVTQIHKLATPLTEDPAKYTGEALLAGGLTDHGQFIPPNSVNIAYIHSANDKINIIPDSASVGFEVRCYEKSELERIDKEIHNICGTPTVLGTKAILKGGIQQGPMEKTPEVEKLFSTYKQAVKEEYNADVVEWTAGGLTVGNTTSKYVPTLDALGVDVDPQCEHSLDEYTDLNSFAPRTVALIRLIERVDKL